MTLDFRQLHQREILEALHELQQAAFEANLNHLPLSPQLIDGISPCGQSLDAERIADA